MIVKKYSDINGIKSFQKEVPVHHKDYDASGLNNLYSEEEKHFWFIARKELIYKQMKKYVDQNASVIEVGAGTGNVSRYLMKKGYQNISVGEMHLNGLKYAQGYGIKKCYQLDLLDMPFENEFDVVCLFDVLEHIEYDEKALQNIHRTLTDRGKLILTVPSHMWLWNKSDRIAGHKRRYSKSELVDKLEKNGFRVQQADYFFRLITPLFYLRRLISRDDTTLTVEDASSYDISINPLTNFILLALSRLENRLSHILPNWFGGSLLLVGEKYPHNL